MATTLHCKLQAAWFGIRNFRARNYLRDAVKPGDLAFFYHSSCAEPGIVGICEVVRGAYPDDDAEKPGHPYYDPKHTKASPRWFKVRHYCIPLLQLSHVVECAAKRSRSLLPCF